MMTGDFREQSASETLSREDRPDAHAMPGAAGPAAPTSRSAGNDMGRRVGSSVRRAGKSLIVPAVLFALWFAIAEAEIVGSIFLPSPERVLSTAVDLRDSLLKGLMVSLQMVLSGFAIGAAAGIATGLILGYSRLARELFELTVDLVRPVPLFALIPLFILWFGIGMLPQIALVALGVFLVLSLTTIEAIRTIPQIYVRAALTSGANRLQVYRTVVIPAIVPHMLGGLRFAVAAAWGLDVAAEFTGSQEGLGYIMIVRGQVLDTAGILVVVFIFCLLAIVFDRAIRAGTDHLTRWRERSAGMGVIGDMLGGR